MVTGRENEHWTRKWSLNATLDTGDENDPLDVALVTRREDDH